MKKLLQSGKVDRFYLYIDAYNQTVNTISGTIITRISASGHYFVSVPIKEKYDTKEERKSHDHL